MKIISVLIAAFGAERWLQACIESVASQNLPAGWQMQILIGVDGCESTLNKAKQLQSTLVTVVSLKQNCGTYVTFNTLMTYAKGEYICRFDADDVMIPGYMEQHIAQMEQGADFTMTWSIYTDADLQPTSHVMAHSHYHPKDGLNKRPCEGCYVAKREIWQALGAYRPWPCGADSDFLARAKALGLTVAVIEQFNYYRRTHENSLTAHPRTNFESPLRQQIIAKVNDYEAQYQAAKMPLMVEPVCGEVAHVYG